MLIKVGYELDTDSIKTCTMLYEWVEPPHDKRKVKPHFSEVGSPGLWSGYYFCSTLVSTSNVSCYKGHCITVGFVPIPKDWNREGIIN